MNWGYIIGWFGVVQALSTAIGFAFAFNWRLSLYYFFAAAIATTILWPVKA
jgi:hypothetical protein